MERKRLLLPGFIPPELCKELVFIHKSCGAVGYRPHVFTTTLSHLVATNSAALIMPFIALRERVKEAVEEFFECEFELFVEFTGLISWTTGANIGWHSDDNRDYLRQRHFSAVCYLNTFEQDFHGGLFRFQDGEPATVIPTLGTILIYSANEDNIHSVDEIVDGERITMALWFTRDSVHDEDRKLIDQLINALPLPREDQDKPGVSQGEEMRGENTCLVSQLSQAPITGGLRDSIVPQPASTNMYWVSERKMEVGCEAAGENLSLEVDQGYDLRVQRLAALGFKCVEQLAATDGTLEKPVRLKYQQQAIAYEFANILHALQVVQFHAWRSSDMAVVCSSSVYCTDQELVQDSKDDEFNKLKRQRATECSMMWANCHSPSQGLVLQTGLVGTTMIEPWEQYMSALWKDLSQMLMAWRNMGSLYTRQNEV